MSFLLLVVWQTLFILQILDWPVFGLQLEQPITAVIMIASFAFFLMGFRRKYPGPEVMLFIGFVITILVSALLNGWLGGGVQRVQGFLLTAGLPYILFMNHAVSMRKQLILISLLLIYSTLMISNGIDQRISFEGLGWAGSRMVSEARITFIGILEDPNDLGQYFVICIPFAAYFFRHARSFFSRSACGALLLALCYGIYMTNSRGTLLGIMGLLALYVYYRYGVKKAVFAVLALLPGVIFTFSQFRAIELEANAISRADTWYTGMQLLEQNPLFGVGMGNFMEYSSLTAHNSYVLVLSELGFIGYALWLGIIIISLYSALHVTRFYRQLLIESGYKRLEPTELNRALALNSAITFSFIGCLICSFFLSRSYVLYIFMLSAFATASYLRVTRLAPDLKIQQPKKLFRYTIAGSFGSIVGMYGITRILLA